jgi:HK97 gp10 family phage protein
MATRVTGDKELIANLRLLAKGIPVRVIDSSAKSAMKPMTDEAKQNARMHRQPGRRPKGGHLDEGIAFRKAKQQTRRRRSYVLGAMNRARRILHLVEFGTMRHWQPNRFGGIWHPGARPYPIMRPAFDNHSDEVSKIFGTDIYAYLQSVISKMKK